MKIVFLELHEWEERYLCERVDGAHEIVAFRDVLGDKTNPELLRRAIQNHLILKKPNVVFTPHNAFNSQEALERILDTTAGNIASFSAGIPKNVVR